MFFFCSLNAFICIFLRVFQCVCRCSPGCLTTASIMYFMTTVGQIRPIMIFKRDSWLKLDGNSFFAGYESHKPVIPTGLTSKKKNGRRVLVRAIIIKLAIRSVETGLASG